MFYARIKNANGEENSKLYFNFREYAKDTFNPLTETVSFIEFAINGNDYHSRKTSCEDIAIEWSHCDSSGLYMSDYMEIGDWFYKNGKRYGLLKEFRENAIV